MTKEEILKEFEDRFCSLRQDGYMELKKHHSPDIKSFISNALDQHAKAEREKLKDKWFYVGEWHDAGCDFIIYDRGVCNCKKIPNQ